MERSTSLNKVEESLRKIPYASSGFHTGEHTITQVNTHPNAYAHAPLTSMSTHMHTHTPQNGKKKSQKLCKKQKAVFSVTDPMPVCSLEGVSGDNMSQFYHAFC